MTAPRYQATRRDEFAIWLANRILRLLASKRCVELLGQVYERGLYPFGRYRDQPNYDWDGVLEYADERYENN